VIPRQYKKAGGGRPQHRPVAARCRRKSFGNAAAQWLYRGDTSRSVSTSELLSPTETAALNFWVNRMA